ncbi:hypothetical protein CKF54_06465 [Psittacicella hinzii]|uniref:ABC3 transporter permease C-terminal domain-containing protein n=1 Tax=Psittacicella hinzii TaxID=2028575 RepID=A0A3A1Y2L8_9GAMM|nr:FtsX-like permease family protein [Psittacicella hinzii]RIY31556.1 hypothetical protein CKF54_06465 [Psittacicella hinzii]
MFTTVLYLSKRFGKAVRRTRFTRISYLLSIVAFVLATLAITLITSVLYSMQQFQKDRLLNYTPQIIVEFNQPLAKVNGETTPQLSQAMQELIQSPIAKDINQLNLYSGGQFFIQVNERILEAQVFGLDNDNPQTRQQLNTNTNAPLNIPPEVANFDLPRGQFTLAIPASVAHSYLLTIGDKVTLINSNKSTYLPTGFMPVMRQFTIAYIYNDASLNDTWYANLYDLARLNLTSNLQQINIFLKDPLQIEQVIPKLGLEAQANYSYSANPQTINGDKLGIVSASDWRQRYAVIFNAIKTEGRVTTTLTSLLIIIAILSCLITFSFIIVEKDRDIAILNVLGMPPAKLNQVFLAMVLGLLIRGNLISIVLFFCITHFWDKYNQYININIPLEINYPSIALTYLSCTAVIFLTTAIAGYFIIRIRPAQVLR